MQNIKSALLNLSCHGIAHPQKNLSVRTDPGYASSTQLKRDKSATHQWSTIESMTVPAQPVPASYVSLITERFPFESV
jgi:hypothetical protein